jgi:hypothetical protein
MFSCVLFLCLRLIFFCVYTCKNRTLFLIIVCPSFHCVHYEQIPYEGWAAPQVIVAVAHRGERLPLPRPHSECIDTKIHSVSPSDWGVEEKEQKKAGMEKKPECVCPAEFLNLIVTCWAQDPAIRPRFQEVEASLAKMPR